MMRWFFTREEGPSYFDWTLHIWLPLFLLLAALVAEGFLVWVILFR